ncbi:hypothetical protein HY546_01190 [archaeon]|nr:hypothetical protein [archaeon]
MARRNYPSVRARALQSDRLARRIAGPEGNVAHARVVVAEALERAAKRTNTPEARLLAVNAAVKRIDSMLELARKQGQRITAEQAVRALAVRRRKQAASAPARRRRRIR